MDIFAAFALEMVVTVLMAFLLIWYLRPSLYRILVDLCGGQDRARFWSSFSTVVLVGAPAASALGYRPAGARLPDAVFDLTRQLGQNLTGFLFALVTLGIVVAFFALVAPRANRERQS